MAFETTIAFLRSVIFSTGLITFSDFFQSLESILNLESLNKYMYPTRLLSRLYLLEGDNINKPDNGVFILLSSLVDLTISFLSLNYQRQYKFIKLSNW